METSRNINIIVAGCLLKSGKVGIGAGGKIPWTSQEDMARFRQITLHSTVIMGRKTWESLPVRFRPLKLRNNIVISNNTQFKCPGAVLARSLDEAISLCEPEKKIFIIGCETLYNEIIDKHPEKINHLYFSAINYDILEVRENEIDTFFHLEKYISIDWKQVETKTYDDHKFTLYCL
jgi:dihydrofolate reductase